MRSPTAPPVRVMTLAAHGGIQTRRHWQTWHLKNERSFPATRLFVSFDQQVLDHAPSTPIQNPLATESARFAACVVEDAIEVPMPTNRSKSLALTEVLCDLTMPDHFVPPPVASEDQSATRHCSKSSHVMLFFELPGLPAIAIPHAR
jgi:hypothetical protein